MKKLAALVAVVVFATVVSPTTTTPQRAQAQSALPDVVVILLDDMRWDELDKMATVNGALIGQGFRFPKAFVTNSLCCPSRATLLTGRYSHGTGVWNNDQSASRGSWLAFKDDEGATIATALDAKGYRTALVGKYLNSYNLATHKPAGWDVWAAYIASTIGYYNYTLTDGVTTTKYGSTAADYSTDVLAGEAEAFIRDTPEGEPLFLEFTPYAPHSPFTPAPRHIGALSSYTPTMPPNVNEADVADKPAWVRRLGGTGSGWTQDKRRQMEMLLSVDEAVGKLLGALADTGRLANTMVLFTSDNGLQLGSHRWGSKKAAYEESIRVPMIWRWDAAGWTGSDARVVRNIDIAPTILGAVGATLPNMDGKSLAPLMTNTATTWQQLFAIERLSDSCAECPPTYCAVRTARHKYVRYGTGEEELYDLAADPYEMRSQHRNAAYSDVKRTLKQRARTLCSPLPPGMAPF